MTEVIYFKQPPAPNPKSLKILERMEGKRPVDTWPDGDLVGRMLGQMISPIAAWDESDLFPAEKENQIR